MRRREFVGLVGGAVAAWPLATRAQQTAMPVVGYLYSAAPEPSTHIVAAVRNGLSEMGYVEGRNVAIEYRFAHNEIERLPELAAELVRRRVAVIAAVDTPSALAAKRLSTTIPIVFETAGDPVQAGLVASLNRPGGNVTGVTSMNTELMPKRLGLLHELMPKSARFAVLVNPNNLASALAVADLPAAAAAIGRHLDIFSASTNREIDAAFASLVQQRPDAVLVAPDNLINTRRIQLVNLAAHHRLPALYADRIFVDVGGLMSYAARLVDLYRQVGIYTGRILKGEKPTDLPVMQPTKFEFVINLQTARTLGLSVPPGLLAIADEVIE